MGPELAEFYKERTNILKVAIRPKFTTKIASKAGGLLASVSEV